MTVRHFFVKSSTQVRHLILRSVASAFMTNPSTRSGWATPGGTAADVLLLALYDDLCILRPPSQIIKAVHALVINMKAFTAQ